MQNDLQTAIHQHRSGQLDWESGDRGKQRGQEPFLRENKGVRNKGARNRFYVLSVIPVKSVVKVLSF